MPEQPLLVAVEGDAHVLELEQLVGRLPAHDLDRVLVAEVVRPLDRVVGVRLPGVLGVEGRVDAALGRVGMRADGVDLGDDPHGCPRLGRAEGGALAGQAGADDEDIMLRHGAGFYSDSAAGAALTGRALGDAAPAGPAGVRGAPGPR